MRSDPGERYLSSSSVAEMTPSSSPAGGLLFALCSATFYGLNIVYARVAALAGTSGSALVLYRVFLMLALIGIAVVAMRRSLAVPREERGTMLLLGVATTLVGICYLSSVAYIPVTVAAVVFYTFPILIVLTSPFVEGTRLTPTLLGIAAMAFLGVMMVVGSAVGDLDWRGLALACAASVATAVQFFAGARCRRTGIFAKVFWIHVLVLPTAALIGFAAGQITPPSALAAAPFAVAMTIGGYVFGIMLQFLALGRITAVAAGIIYCMEPVVAAAASVVLLDETLSPPQMLGGILVLCAIIANVLMEQRRMRQAPLVPIAD